MSFGAVAVIFKSPFLFKLNNNTVRLPAGNYFGRVKTLKNKEPFSLELNVPGDNPPLRDIIVDMSFVHFYKGKGVIETFLFARDTNGLYNEYKKYLINQMPPQI